MKETYSRAEMEIEIFDVVDVITDSRRDPGEGPEIGF